MGCGVGWADAGLEQMGQGRSGLRGMRRVFKGACTKLSIHIYIDRAIATRRSTLVRSASHVHFPLPEEIHQHQQFSRPSFLPIKVHGQTRLDLLALGDLLEQPARQTTVHPLDA